MDREAFLYPKLHYFKSENTFTGSYKGLNYKLVPREDSLLVSVWYGIYCSEVSEMVAEITLPLTDEGLAESREYLWAQYLEMLKKEQ